MNKEERELTAEEIASFRYGVIADLLNSHLGRGELDDIVKQKAKMKHKIPHSKRTAISTGCIRKWLFLYRKYGKDGLKPKPRKDAGVSKALPLHESSLILAALEKKPYLTAASVVKLLQQEGEITNAVSKSALSRLVIASGLTRRERLKIKDEEQNLKFDFFYPLECVQADDLHAFPVPDQKGNKRKAILMAFIDDATRRIIYADFSFSERSLAFEIGIKHILKAHGRIGQLYVDNGSPFVSNQTKRILDILRIRICHSRPGIPKGRGKIERFFRTVRDQFLRPLDEANIKGVEDLNIRFHTWLESEYHRNPHRGIGKRTPIESWLDGTKYITVMDASIDIDRVFYHLQYRKVYRDSTFTLDGVLYEAPSVLTGEKITLSYDPLPERRRVFVDCDGKEYGEARPVNSFANAHVIRNKNSHLFAIEGGIPELKTQKPDAKSDIRFSLDAVTFKGEE
jgi:transposase